MGSTRPNNTGLRRQLSRIGRSYGHKATDELAKEMMDALQPLMDQLETAIGNKTLSDSNEPDRTFTSRLGSTTLKTGDGVSTPVVKQLTRLPRKPFEVSQGGLTHHQEIKSACKRSFMYAVVVYASQQKEINDGLGGTVTVDYVWVRPLAREPIHKTDPGTGQQVIGSAVGQMVQFVQEVAAWAADEGITDRGANKPFVDAVEAAYILGEETALESGSIVLVQEVIQSEIVTLFRKGPSDIGEPFTVETVKMQEYFLQSRLCCEEGGGGPDS